MKITLRILTILTITLLVAGGIYLLIENTSIASSLSTGPESERSSRPKGGEMGSGERSEGDHDHNQRASLAGGLAEMSGSIAKLSVITTIVLAVQFILARFKKRATIRNLAT